VTETAHTRSRRAALGGLLIQLVAFLGLLALFFATRSHATYHAAWYVLAGVPIWFVALLVFRQRELAALEALDLEELRREKQASGGGDAMFGEEGSGGLAFRVAETRLRWMQRWMVPGFGLATGIYLAGAAFILWRRLAVALVVENGENLVGYVVGERWEKLYANNIPMSLLLLAVLMLGTFLFSRYASGMGRVKDWGLLRACGAAMLGNTIAIMLLMVSLGIFASGGSPEWEQRLAYALPVFMGILAAEVLVNFVLDIYRPRAPGVESRACFDSRLLGLLAEPGGIAHSVAEALNYQFGFKVSQTWFYQLLERTFVPLVTVGAVVLWLLTAVVVVQPYEHVIVERWGRQINPGGTDAQGRELPKPWEPGLHLKWPYPIEVARAYNTGQLHQISIGWARFDAEPNYDEATKKVVLWTDTMHMGLKHHDFLTCRAADIAPTPGMARADDDPDSEGATPVHMMRMETAVHYRIRHEDLGVFSRTMADAHQAMRDIAWEELVRFNANATGDFLMGTHQVEIGSTLKQRLNARVKSLGLEVVYVGVTNVHPEKTVAEAYRKVIAAEHERLAAIRQARVIENQRLSAVAGDAHLARTLSRATDRSLTAQERYGQVVQTLRLAGVVDAGFSKNLTAYVATWPTGPRAAAPETDAGAQALADLQAGLAGEVGTERGAALAGVLRRLAEHAPLLRTEIVAAAALEDARERATLVEENYELGFGETVDSVVRAQQAARVAAQELERTAATVEAAVEPLRTECAAIVDAAAARELLDGVRFRLAATHWNNYLHRGFGQERLGGAAATELAKAAADRWEIEQRQRADLVRVRQELPAYEAAPEVYKSRRLIDTLVNGIKDARKYFLAFDPGDRAVRVRFVSEAKDKSAVEEAATAPPEY
jgi:regulator of protease activity HflC (stomatin/prohibitin superfamily)